MFRSFLTICVLLAFPALVRAQISAKVVLEQDKLLPAEEFLAGVRVVNRSGQTLHLGAAADWIEFVIERPDGGILPRITPPPVRKPFDLESSKQGTLKVDLAPCFRLREPGIYRIHAVVKIEDLNLQLTTASVPFEIIEGNKIWEQVVGVPRKNSSSPLETRIYTLQQANYLKEPRLYLRVSAASGEIIKIVNIGPLLAFGRPDPIVDRESRLHLLQQIGPRRSWYLVFGTEGDLVRRQTYEYASARPRLHWSEKGEIEVKGGERRPSLDDVPAETETTNDDSEATTP